MPESIDRETKEKALKLIARGKSNSEIQGLVPQVSLSTLKRWRRDLLRAATEPQSKKTKEHTYRKFRPDARPSDPLEEEMFSDDTDADSGEQCELGEALRAMLKQFVYSCTKIAHHAADASYVHTQSAKDLADLIEVMANKTLILVEASQRADGTLKPGEGSYKGSMN